MKSEKAYINVLILYFSATGNTAKIEKVVAEKFEEEGIRVTMFDILPNHQDLRFSHNYRPDVKQNIELKNKY